MARTACQSIFPISSAPVDLISTHFGGMSCELVVNWTGAEETCAVISVLGAFVNRRNEKGMMHEKCS